MTLLPVRRSPDPRKPDESGFYDSREEFYKLIQQTDLFTGKGGNTTISAIITNGRFSKAELNKLASMTRCAYARCINPVGTMADGDSIYAASIGNVPADLNMTGTLAAEVMARPSRSQSKLPGSFRSNYSEFPFPTRDSKRFRTWSPELNLLFHKINKI